MKVVIDIPDEVAKENTPKAYFEYFGAWSSNLTKAFENAVVLPKGHGRLIDADEEIKYARKWIEHPNQYISQRNKDFIYYLENAETVIPADK